MPADAVSESLSEHTPRTRERPRLCRRSEVVTPAATAADSNETNGAERVSRATRKG